MSDKLTMTLGAKAAMDQNIDIKATVHSVDVEVKLTRRYIWLMKLRYIWAVIRADMGKNK